MSPTPKSNLLKTLYIACQRDSIKLSSKKRHQKTHMLKMGMERNSRKKNSLVWLETQALHLGRNPETCFKFDSHFEHSLLQSFSVTLLQCCMLTGKALHFFRLRQCILNCEPWRPFWWVVGWPKPWGYSTKRNGDLDVASGAPHIIGHVPHFPNCVSHDYIITQFGLRGASQRTVWETCCDVASDKCAGRPRR